MNEFETFNHCWPECAAEEHLMEIWQKEAGAVVYKHGPPMDHVKLSASKTVVSAAYNLASNRRAAEKARYATVGSHESALHLLRYPGSSAVVLFAITSIVSFANQQYCISSILRVRRCLLPASASLALTVRANCAAMNPASAGQVSPHSTRCWVIWVVQQKS
eukprot:SAG25_NODE_676_length_5980_cov_37.613671_3_plen_162_part_00